MAIATDTEEFYIPIGHQGSLMSPNYEHLLPRDLFYSDALLIMHNAKFDMQMLGSFKLNTSQLVDTLIVSHYIDEYPPHGLKDLASIRLGYDEPKAKLDFVKRMEKISGGYESIPTPVMADYAMQDARMTRDLFFNLVPEWLPEHKDLWQTTDRPFQACLAKLEERGLLLDLSLASLRSSEAGKRLREIVETLGFDPAKSRTLAEKIYGLPPHGLGLKPSYTEAGNLRTDDAVLATVPSPLGPMVQEFRRFSKMKSAYYDAYLDLARHDGRLHSNFKMHGTLTGRLSCEAPNLQQIPRDVDLKPIKRLFVPEPGHQLWEFDFANLEARLAAVYAKDNSMLSVFREGGDLHQMIADRLGVSRHTAKTTVFLILYGGGASKLADQLNIPVNRAQRILADMKDEFPSIFQTMYQATATADNMGWVKYWTKRRRHFKYQKETYKAFNSIIQGGAFEIVKRGMINLYEAGYDLCNTVHDSVWVEIPDEDVLNAKIEIPRLMSGWCDDAFGLPFPVDPKRLN